MKKPDDALASLKEAAAYISSWFGQGHPIAQSLVRGVQHIEVLQTQVDELSGECLLLQNTCDELRAQIERLEFTRDRGADIVAALEREVSEVEERARALTATIALQAKNHAGGLKQEWTDEQLETLASDLEEDAGVIERSVGDDASWSVALLRESAAAIRYLCSLLESERDEAVNMFEAYRPQVDASDEYINRIAHLTDELAELRAKLEDEQRTKAHLLAYAQQLEAEQDGAK